MLILACVVFGVGIVMMLLGRRDYRRYLRITDTCTTRIADAPGAGTVQIRGFVVAGADTVAGALSGNRGVWATVQVEELRVRGDSSRAWVAVHTETASAPFWIRDDSGQSARIEPAGGELVIEMHEVASSGTLSDPAPDMQRFLQSRALQSTNLIGMNRTLRVLEGMLCSDEPACAFGRSRRDPGDPVHDGYRMAPSQQLVLFHGVREEDELIVSNQDQATLAEGLRGWYPFAVALTICSAIGVIAAAIDAAW